MTSTYTTNKNIEKPAYNDYASSPTGWSAPINSDWDIIDRSLGGTQVKNPTGVSGTVDLTVAECQPPIIIIGTSLTGTATLTANVVYRIPSGVGGVWTFYNNTTGSFTVTISSAGGGTSVAIIQGYHTTLYSDGTNIKYADDRIPFAAGSNTQIQFNNSGYLGAASGMVWDGTTLTANAVASTTSVAATTTVTAGTTVSDGIGNLRTVPQNAQGSSYILSATDAGKYVSISSGTITVPNGVFSTGQTVSVYNNSSSNLSILQGSGAVLTLAATTLTGNRTLANYGLATILCTGSGYFVITGAGIS